MSKYVYSEHTYNSKNPLARFAHRYRFSLAMKILSGMKFNSVLDYGAGDNRFLSKINNKDVKLYAFEPIQNVDSTENITVYKTIEQLQNKRFDVITCFEVLEHFNEESQLEFINRFHNLLSVNGKVIISVPVEIGISSLIKNIRRLRYGKKTYKDYLNIWRCLWGLEVPEIRKLEGFIPSHIGFNHNRLEVLLKKFFKIKKRIYSPIKFLPATLNSQVFYILKKI